jgi:hypothetical protein
MSRSSTGPTVTLRRVAAAMALAAVLAFAMSLPAAATPPDTFRVQEAKCSVPAIQRQALGALRAMGFKPSEARALVRLTERGGAEAASARSIAGARSRGERIDPRVLGRLEAHGGPSSAGGSVAARTLRRLLEELNATL